MIPRATSFLLAAPLALLLLAFGGQPLAAQSGVGGGAGPNVQLFQFSDASVTGVHSAGLFTMPVAAGAEVGQGVWIRFSSTWARAWMERADGESVELTGLTDSRIELSWTAPGGWLSLSTIGVIPTGTTGFSTAEAELAGLMAVDLLPFQVSNWGTGGGIGAGFSAVRSEGPWGFGISSSYLSSGQFEPVSDPAFEYRPGDQWNSRAVVDRRIGATSRTSLSVAMNRSGDDQVNQENVVRPGNRLQVLNSWAFPAGATGSGLVYGGYLHRSGAIIRTPAGPSSALATQGLVLFGAGLRQPSSHGVLVPTADVRILRREDGQGQGWILGVGASVERRSGSITWIPSLIGRVGGIRAASEVDSGMTGLELGMRVRFGSTNP